MKGKFVMIFFIFLLCVLAFIHTGFVEPEKEVDVHLDEVEALSTSEESLGECNVAGGWCFINVPKKGIHTL